MKKLMMLLAICVAFLATFVPTSYAVREGQSIQSERAIERMEKQAEKQKESRERAEKVERESGNSEKEPSLAHEFWESTKDRFKDGVEGGIIGGMAGAVVGHPGEAAAAGATAGWIEGGWKDTKENWPKDWWPNSQKPAKPKRGSEIKPQSYKSSSSNFEIPKGAQTGWKSSRHRSR